jgi:hypothetical protein
MRDAVADETDPLAILEDGRPFRGRRVLAEGAERRHQNHQANRCLPSYIVV